MYLFSEGEWQLQPGPEFLSSIFMVSLVALDEHLLGISPEDEWFEYDGQVVRTRPDMNRLPFKGSITSARRINSHHLVITTQLGKVIYLNLENGKTDVIDVARDFLPEVALSHTGDTLVVDNLGFYSVHWPARWRKVDSNTGLAGSVKRIVKVGNQSYVLSSSVIFMSDSPSGQFKRSHWTDYEAWDLLKLDDDSLLLADSYAIKHIRGDNITLVDERTTARLFLQSMFNPDLIYVGTELGFQVLRRVAGTWEVIFSDAKMDNLRVNKIIEISPTEVLVSSERAGIQKLDLSGLDNGVVDAYRYGQEDGLLATDPAGRSVISQVNGQIIASTDNGFFVFDYNAFSPTAMDGLADLVPPGTVLDFVEQGETWAYTYNRLFKKNGAWYEEDVARLSEGGFETVSYLGDQLVVGGLGNILVFDNKGERPEPAAPPVTLSLVARYSGDLEPQLLPLDDVEFSTKDRLTLKYAVADFYDPNQVRYRTRLEPNETQFSDWSSSSEQSLVALAPGEYTFRVEAKDSLNQVSRLAVPITVAPQWFETHWFRITVAITVFAALYFLGTYAMRRRSRLLALERDRLETMVSERTRALESANKQLDQMAHLDGLTQIANRRRLDSYLDDVWRQCVDRNRMMAIAIIDVDDFKKYNDTHGHQAGDELLVSLAQTLSANLRRAEDLVARYGGEDFLVVLPGAEESTAKQVIEEMRRQVETSDLGVTVSAGIHANTPHNAMPLEQMISTADRALYQSKSEGRNRVTVLS